MLFAKSKVLERAKDGVLRPGGYFLDFCLRAGICGSKQNMVPQSSILCTVTWVEADTKLIEAVHMHLVSYIIGPREWLLGRFIGHKFDLDPS